MAALGARMAAETWPDRWTSRNEAKAASRWLPSRRHTRGLFLALASTGLALRLAVKIAMASLLLVIHVFALFFYAALLAGVALGPRFAALATIRGLAGGMRAVAVSAAPTAIPALVFVALVPSLPGAHDDAAGNAPLWDFSLLAKLHVLLSPIVT